MDLERELLAIFGGHEILMANGQRELLVGLKLTELGGIGVGGSAGFGIEIVFEYVSDLARNHRGGYQMTPTRREYRPPYPGVSDINPVS